MVDVFRDRPLATRIRSLEEEASEAGDGTTAAQAIAQAIRARYETVPGGVDASSFERSVSEPSEDQAQGAPSDPSPVVAH